jgi:MFS transporter, DHA2 family, integral membrane protein
MSLNPESSDRARSDQVINPWWTLAVLCLSLVMVVLGNTVLNVALPTLVRELHATSTELQWMVDSYALVFAGLLLTAGALGDRFGRKGALVIGLVIFGGASFASTFATEPVHIIATRAVMGLGAALVMPATLSILTTVFPPTKRAQAIAIWAGFAGAGAAIGPIAGGWLLEHFYWGSVFYLNVPVVLIALIGGRFLVPTSSDPEHATFDLVGAGLSIVGMGALLYGIIEAPTYGWTDPLPVAAFVLAIVVLGTFGWWELRHPNPMLDLKFFRNPRFSAASAAISLNFFAMFGTFFLLTQYLQVVRGYSPLGAGLRTLPMAFTMMFAAPMSARFVQRFGPKRVMSTGLALVGLGLALMSQVDESTSYSILALFLVIAASGMASTMAPATASIMSSLPMRKAGVGSAWNDTTRELGGALGVAVLGSIAGSAYTSRLADALPSGIPSAVSNVAESSVGAAVQISQSLPGNLGPSLEAAAKSAFVGATSEALLIAAGVVFVAAALVARYMPAVHVHELAPEHPVRDADAARPVRSEA